MQAIFRITLFASSAIAGVAGIAGAIPAIAQTTATTSQSAAASPASQSSADDQASGLADIVVTGTKTGATVLQRTPVAISVIDDKLLQGQGLNTIRDFAKYVPNLVFSQNGGQALVYIRGIGSNNGTPGGDPSVTQQVDGVYIARAAAQIGDFIDIERVEVLRGPQGTLYGRNAAGGTLNVISRQPSTQLGGQLRVGYGNYGTKSVEAYLTGPLAGDALTASIAGTYRYHDAFFHNVVPGVPGTVKINRAGARAQLRWRPTPDLDMTLRGDFAQTRDTTEAFDHLLLPTAFSPLANALIGGYRDIAIDGVQPLRLNTRGTSFDFNYDLGNGFKFKSITAFRHMDTQYAADADGTEVNVVYTAIVERQNQATQEFNLTYSSDRLRAVVGLYYFGDSDDGISTSRQPPSIFTSAAASNQANAVYGVKTRSYAAFGQLDFNLTRQLSVIVGLRYTEEKKTLDLNYDRNSLNPATLGVSLAGFPAIYSDVRHDHALTPKFGINFQANPDLLMYASATRGFKAGGFNATSTDKARAGFNPEKVWAYELGTKVQLFEDKLRVNIAGFIYDYTDLQVRQRFGSGLVAITNASAARIKGVEVESTFKPIPTLQFSGNISYLNARYRNFPFSPVGGAFAPFVPGLFPCPAGGSCFSATGKRMEASPMWSGVVGVDFSPKLGNSDYTINFHADYYRRGLVYFDASNVAISGQPAYGLLNGNISLAAAAGWRIEAYVNNAANTKYYQNIGSGIVVPAAVVGDPRTYGVRLGYKF